jgi:transposase
LDENAISANQVGKTYHIDGKQLGRHYKNHLSDYNEWDQLEHCKDWILYPKNMGHRLCLDEVALSSGELYTVLTNGEARCQKGSIIAMIKGVKAENVIEVLKKIPEEVRNKVYETSTDLARNMEQIAATSFPNTNVVDDRFHVAKLISDAVQTIRIKYRWEAIAEEAKQIKALGKRYEPIYFSNGDSQKQLLARSRYLLFKTEKKWTDSQKKRAKILFKEYPEIYDAYKLSMMFRNIYQTAKNKEEAANKINQWIKKIEEKDIESFSTAARSIESHKNNILNFFINRTTNAMAESFNSKIKAFRQQFRGVKDVPFFLFRLSKILA